MKREFLFAAILAGNLLTGALCYAKESAIQPPQAQAAAPQHPLPASKDRREALSSARRLPQEMEQYWLWHRDALSIRGASAGKTGWVHGGSTLQM
jgi:hypothetical protein